MNDACDDGQRWRIVAYRGKVATGNSQSQDVNSQAKIETSCYTIQNVE